MSKQTNKFKKKRSESIQNKSESKNHNEKPTNFYQVIIYKLQIIIDKLKTNILLQMTISGIMIFATIVSLYVFYENKLCSYGYLKEKLSEANTHENWQEMKNLLDKDCIKSDINLRNLYYYYKAVLESSNPLGFPNSSPDNYVNMIDPSSEYYMLSKQGLFKYYLNKYGTKSNIIFDKAGEIAKSLEKDNSNTNFYYYMKLLYLGLSDYSAIYKLYVNYKNEQQTVINYDDYSTKPIKHGLYIDIYKLQEIIDLFYMFYSYMAISAHNQCLYKEKEFALSELNKVLKGRGENKIALITLSNLNVPELLIKGMKIINNYTCSYKFNYRDATSNSVDIDSLHK